MDLAVVLLIFLLFIGVIGTFLPVLPGIPFMFLVIIGFSLAEGFHYFSTSFIVVTAILAGISLLVNYFSGIVGAKKYGASKLGVAMGLIGGFAALFMGGPFGFVLGAFLGVVVGELINDRNRDTDLIFKSAFGSLIGILGGVFIQFMMALVIFVAALFQIFK